MDPEARGLPAPVDPLGDIAKLAVRYIEYGNKLLEIATTLGWKPPVAQGVYFETTCHCCGWLSFEGPVKQDEDREVTMANAQKITLESLQAFQRHVEAKHADEAARAAELSTTRWVEA